MNNLLVLVSKCNKLSIMAYQAIINIEIFIWSGSFMNGTSWVSSIPTILNKISEATLAMIVKQFIWQFMGPISLIPRYDFLYCRHIIVKLVLTFHAVLHSGIICNKPRYRPMVWCQIHPLSNVHCALLYCILRIYLSRGSQRLPWPFSLYSSMTWCNG